MKGYACNQLLVIKHNSYVFTLGTLTFDESFCVHRNKCAYTIFPLRENRHALSRL